MGCSLKHQYQKCKDLINKGEINIEILNEEDINNNNDNKKEIFEFQRNSIFEKNWNYKMNQNFENTKNKDFKFIKNINNGSNYFNTTNQFSGTTNNKIVISPMNKTIISNNSESQKKETIISKVTDSDLINQTIESNDNLISLGINIGASKTVYSIFSKINNKYVSNVLLMNNSSRIIPSIICYTKAHRLFGDNSISSLKQNLNTSYNNLSRLIGYNKNDNIFKEEIKFMFSKENNLEEIGSECIIADYLSLINKYYFEKENIEYDYTIISVPDFYTLNQKQELKLICESIGMKDIKIIDESTAITMYYGYNKYRDLFAYGNNIYENIEKYILFVDVGYSKTSFILSYLNIMNLE